MTKKEQESANFAASLHFDLALMGVKPDSPKNRLRTCNATVIESDTNYYVLCSYNTIVACMHKTQKIVYDLLRREYGYTATSAQHIAKFAWDYGATKKITWREI